MPNIIRIRNLERELTVDNDIVFPIDSLDYYYNAKSLSILDLKTWVISGFTGTTEVIDGTDGTSGTDGINGINGTSGSSGIYGSGLTYDFYAINLNGGTRVLHFSNGYYIGYTDLTTTTQYTPIAICGINKTFCKIAAADVFSLAIDKYGQAWSWGINDFGELGNNNSCLVYPYAYIATPVKVCGIHTFCSIAGGFAHSIGIDKNGKAWGWGYNYYGQVGNNTTIDKSTPIALCGSHTFCSIALGYYHSLGVDNHNKVWSWGYNYRGQLGNNSTVDKYIPVSVCNI